MEQRKQPWEPFVPSDFMKSEASGTKEDQMGTPSRVSSSGVTCEQKMLPPSRRVDLGDDKAPRMPGDFVVTGLSVATKPNQNLSGHRQGSFFSVASQSTCALEVQHVMHSLKSSSTRSIGTSVGTVGSVGTLSPRNNSSKPSTSISLTAVLRSSKWVPSTSYVRPDNPVAACLQRERSGSTVWSGNSKSTATSIRAFGPCP